MAKRMTWMLIITGALVVFLGSMKYRQIQVAIADASAFQPPPEAVTTIVAKQEDWPEILDAIGSVAAVHGVNVSADLSGIVEAIDFDSGKTVRAGDMLVRLDTRQEKAQLAAAQAERNLAEVNLQRMAGLRAKGVASQAEYDKAAAEAEQAEAKVNEIRATIDRKTIRAPFSGILGIRQINLGQYLEGGNAVVPLQSLDPIYVNFSVPQQEVHHLRAGAEVNVMVEGAGNGPAQGRITAIDSIVDQATRNVSVQATLPNRDGMLRPGMFVQIKLTLSEGDPVVTLPTSSINYAPYGDSVFIVEDLKNPKGETYRGLRQQFVKLGGSRGDQIAVLSGVRAGEEVVTSGVFKLRNGAAVSVNNEVQPGNNPAPEPEDS
jgi:membrane fusion protein (multidrug efflux system)